MAYRKDDPLSGRDRRFHQCCCQKTKIITRLRDDLSGHAQSVIVAILVNLSGTTESMWAGDEKLIFTE